MTTWGRHRIQLLVVAVGWMTVAAPMSGKGRAAGANVPAYDVVSIHPTDPDNHMMRLMTSANGPSVSGVPLNSLISDAYRITSLDQISGVSGSFSSARFDIEAKRDKDIAAPATDSRPAIFTALQEQLGLKLESAKEPVDVIVVDHGEMPSDN